MLSTLNKVVDDIEKGVYDFTKDGKCSGCGQCCSVLLPLSRKEIKDIKRYIRKNNIKECKHFAPTINQPLDLTCPFLDYSREADKCVIYKVRPEICRVFQCNKHPSQIKKEKELFWKNRKPCHMREIFFGDR